MKINICPNCGSENKYNILDGEYECPKCKASIFYIDGEQYNWSTGALRTKKLRSEFEDKIMEKRHSIENKNQNSSDETGCLMVFSTLFFFFILLILAYWKVEPFREFVYKVFRLWSNML